MKLRYFVGNSPWTHKLRQQVETAAPFSSSVLVTGPSGTGKELVARALHEQSPRAQNAFVPVDCTSLTGELFASHLFGHIKGAFTGANHDRLGCFRVANGGTLFLDEIGEMSLEMQAKLLRVLQERVVAPLGSDAEIPVDVRIVAATNRNLLEEVKAGRFRLDLYYRLNVVSIETLRLAERIEDIEPLTEHFLAKLEIDQGFPRRRCSAAALAMLQNYSWPGNVRELQNILERAAIFTQGDTIGAESIPHDAETDKPIESIASDFENHDDLLSNAKSDAFGASHDASISDDSSAGAWPSLNVLERRHIEATLPRAMWNQSLAAKMLGIDRASLARKIKRYSIDLPTARRGRPAK
jgi:DNA-binding NtrC family response regulator